MLTLLLVLAAPVGAWDRLALFDEAAELVESQFYDERMNGVDWPAAVAEYRRKVDPGMDRQAFARLFNALLGRLATSHTRLVTRDTPEWFQLAGVFVDGYPPLAEALAPHLANGAPIYTGIGVLHEDAVGADFVAGVLQGSPAEAAGLLTGDRLIAVDGASFHPIRSFAGNAGRELTVTVERRPGQRRDLTVTPVQLDGRNMFADAMQASVRVIERDAAQVGYVHAWSYAGQRYQDILVDALSNGALRAADALVLDIRGGWGGASPGFLNVFTDRVLEAHSISRQGERNSFSSGWSRPVVLLTDQFSRSGKELIAYGFRVLGKGPIVGETTGGAVVAGRINALSDGSLLYVASADVQVDGRRLEGLGVTPDIIVPFDVRYAAGADPQLDRALDEAARLARQATR